MEVCKDGAPSFEGLHPNLNFGRSTRRSCWPWTLMHSVQAKINPLTEDDRVCRRTTFVVDGWMLGVVRMFERTGQRLLCVAPPAIPIRSYSRPKLCPVYVHY